MPTALCALAAAAVVAALDVAPQDPERLALVARMDVRGLEAATPEHVRAALLLDQEFVAALDAAPDERAITALVRSQVTDLMHQIGFAGATVEIGGEAGRMRCTVAPGPRRRCGAVRVLGAEAIAPATLAAALTAPERSYPGWDPASWSRSDGRAAAGFAAHAERLYRAHGRHGARCQVTFVRDGDALDLVVAVRDEGQAVEVGSLELRGDDDAGLALARAAAAFSGPQPFTTEFAGGLRDRLLALGRYVGVELPDPLSAPAAGFDPLVVTLRPAPDLPPVDDPRWRDIAQLRRGIDWYVNELETRCALRLEFTPADAMELWGCAVLGPWTVHLSRDGVLLRADRLRWPDGRERPLWLGLRVDGCLLWLGGRPGVTAFDGPADVALSVVAAPAADGEMELRWGFGVATGGKGGVLHTLVHPFTATRVFARDAPYMRRDGDSLVFADAGRGPLRVAADGVVSRSARIPGAGFEVEVSLTEQPLDAEWSRALAALDGEPAPVAAVLVETAVAIARGAIPDLEVPAELVATALGQVLDGPAAAAAAPTSTPFEVTHGQAFPQVAGQWVRARALLDLDGAARDRVLTLCDSLAAADRRRREAVQELMSWPDAGAGPVWLSAAAGVMRLYGQDRARRALTDLARERCSFAHVVADLELLLDGWPAADQSCVELARRWRGCAALDATFADLGEQASDREVLRRGLEALWNAGLGDALRAALQ